MLPNENENREDIIRHFAGHFANCAEMVAYSQRAADSITAQAKSCELETSTLAILVNKIVRESRKLRSIAVLCERGFVGEAEQLVRSSFEGALAARFVCLSPVPAGERPTGIQDHGYPPIPSGRNPIDFRALIYAGHQLMQKHLASADAKVCAIVPQEAISRIATDATWLKSQIGPEWSARIGKTKGYSGLSVKDLAGNYGLLDLYDNYKEMSNRTHANDAFACVSFNSDGSINVFWCGKDEKQIPLILKIGSSFVADTCRTVLNAVGASTLANEAYVLAKAINDFEP